MFLVRPRGQSAAGGLRASMRFMGPEKGGVVVVSRTPGLLGCWGFQAAGASRLLGLPHLMLIPLLRVEVKGRKVVAEVDMVAHNGVGSQAHTYTHSHSAQHFQPTP
jgi:hypothetical protein